MTYKLFSLDGSVHSFPIDGTQDEFITEAMVPINEAEANIIRATEQAALAASLYNYTILRSAAYRTEADPLFFQYQRGEATRDEWIAKVNEIKARFPEIYVAQP